MFEKVSRSLKYDSNTFFIHKHIYICMDTTTDHFTPLALRVRGNDWFGTVTSKGQKLSRPILKEKAEDLAKKLGNPSFVATEGWLSRWKARHQIRYKRAHGEKGSADTQSAEEWIR